MNNRQLREVLKDSLSMEKELYDFCIEALTKLYPEDLEKAIVLFESSYDQFDYNGCLQSLEMIDKNIKKQTKKEE